MFKPIGECRLVGKSGVPKVSTVTELGLSVSQQESVVEGGSKRNPPRRPDREAVSSRKSHSEGRFQTLV